MDGQTLLKLYRQMLLMRRFEEAAAQAYTERKIGGFLHLYIGQEAVSAGVTEACKPEDYIITAYRDHAHYLARDGSARAGMAELFGKATGCSQGRGGSMHFYNIEKNFMGGWGIVGAHIPIAAGLAFASKYKKEKRVTICYFGEGAASIGPFHEGLCLAALYKLPVVFIIENNFYSMGTPQHRSMATNDVSIRALAYPMARASVDGCDLEAVYSSAREAIDRARNESLPTLIEYKTYRYRGHSMADPAKYRTKEEVEKWKQRDPLTLVRERIEKEFPQFVAKFESIEKSVDEEVADAVKFADESPLPDPSTVGDYTYI